MMSDTFQLFVYGTLQTGGSAANLLSGCEPVGTGQVGGILYDIDGEFPALVVYGTAPVRGEIWRCPADLLGKLDEYEDTASGLFRRIGLSVQTTRGPVACWTYVAGPRLARLLLPARRIESWTNSGVVSRES
jgi:gamma-glutamylcyclotransferase (GGCT)/AIG2-like uncharacterized protein YtfP